MTQWQSNRNGDKTHVLKFRSAQPLRESINLYFNPKCYTFTCITSRYITRLSIFHLFQLLLFDPTMQETLKSTTATIHPATRTTNTFFGLDNSVIMAEALCARFVRNLIPA
eukprot:853002_1